MSHLVLIGDIIASKEITDRLNFQNRRDPDRKRGGTAECAEKGKGPLSRGTVKVDRVRR